MDVMSPEQSLEFDQLDDEVRRLLGVADERPDAVEGAIDAALQAILKRCAPALMNSASPAGEGAEDAVQEALARFATRLREASFRERVTAGRPHAFLFVMVRNRAIDHRRAFGARMRTVDRLLEQEAGLSDSTGDQASLPDSLKRRDLERLLSVLSPVDKVLVMRFFAEGFTSNEVAEELSMTPAAVRQRGRRALQLIRDALLDEETGL